MPKRRRNKIQLIMVQPFSYMSDSEFEEQVSTTLTVCLSGWINVDGPAGSVSNQIKLEIEGRSKPEWGRAVGDYWEDTTSTSSSDEEERAKHPHRYRLFRFDLKEIPVGTDIKYSILVKTRKDGFQPLEFARVHKERRHLRTKQYATHLSLKPPAAAQNAKTDFRFATSADQEVMGFFGDRPGKWEIPFSDNRDATVKIYKRIANQRYDLFAHLGDAFMGEGAPPIQVVKKKHDFLRHLYEDFTKVVGPNLAQVASSRVLDDHDFGRNGADAEAYAQDRQDSERAGESRGIVAGLQAFQELWPVLSVDGRRGGADERGLYYETVSGDIHCFHLHNRLYANENSLLGDVQRAWLEDRLLQTDGVKLIFTPLPFVMGKEPGEDYRRHASKWKELLELFAVSGVKAIFSADSHNYSRSELVVERDGRTYVIPHYVVGTLGGIVQYPSANEFTSMKNQGRGLTPPDVESIHAEVATYYGRQKSYIERHNRLYERRTRRVKKVEQKFGYVDAVIQAERSSGPRQLKTNFLVTADTSSSSDEGFDNVDVAQYPCSENEAICYHRGSWPERPVPWRAMEIEAKWEIDRDIYRDLIAKLVHETKYMGFDLQVRWKGAPRVFVDYYYDTANGALRESLHNVRARSQFGYNDVSSWGEHWNTNHGNDALFDKVRGDLASGDATTLRWQRVQYKSTPTRIGSVWFRHEVGNCRIYDRKGEKLCSGFEDNKKDAHLDALRGAKVHSAVTLMRREHPDIKLDLPEHKSEVLDLRYRIVFARAGRKLYEMSLDHVQTTRKGESSKSSFEAELEALPQKVDGQTVPLTEIQMNGLFRLADKLQWLFQMVPSTRTKGGIEVRNRQLRSAHSLLGSANAAGGAPPAQDKQGPDGP